VVEPWGEVRPPSFWFYNRHRLGANAPEEEFEAIGARRSSPESSLPPSVDATLGTFVAAEIARSRREGT
jgi:hypothetical protein